jgi:hypothetical protein
MMIDAAEAGAVQRIFQDFADHRSIKTIVRELNGDAIRGRRSLGRGWSPATVSRILKN